MLSLLQTQSLILRDHLQQQSFISAHRYLTPIHQSAARLALAGHTIATLPCLPEHDSTPCPHATIPCLRRATAPILTVVHAIESCITGPACCASITPMLRTDAAMLRCAKKVQDTFFPLPSPPHCGTDTFLRERV